MILLELSARYKPLAPHGRFSGYAAMFLPRRLGDRWHSWHPEHRYVTDPETGRRRWQYDPASLSLDQVMAATDDNHHGETRPHAGDRELLHARALKDFVPTCRTVSVPLAA